MEPRSKTATDPVQIRLIGRRGLNQGPIQDLYTDNVVDCTRTIDYYVGSDRSAFRPCHQTSVWHRSLPTGFPFQFHRLSGGTIEVRRDTTGIHRNWVVKPQVELAGDICTGASGGYSSSGRFNTRVLGPTEKQINEAIQDAVVGVCTRPVQGESSTPQFLAEFRDISRTMKSLGRLTKWARSVASVDDLASFSTLGAAADAWLTSVFGVVPTARDIKALWDQKGMQFARPTIRPYRKGQTVRCSRHLVASTSVPEELFKVYNPTVELWGGQFDGYLDRDGTWSAPPGQLNGPAGWMNSPPAGVYDEYAVTDVQIQAFARVARDVNFQGSSRFAVGAEPLKLAWELCPFSFVVDWFANYGKWLTQMNRLAEARYGGFYIDRSIGVWVGIRRRVTLYRPVIDVVMPSPLADVTWKSQSGRYRTYWRGSYEYKVGVRYEPVRREVTYDRYKWGDPPTFVHLQTKGLGEQGWFQWATGSALAVQNCQWLQRLMRRK